MDAWRLRVDGLLKSDPGFTANVIPAVWSAEIKEALEAAVAAFPRFVGAADADLAGLAADPPDPDFEPTFPEAARLFAERLTDFEKSAGLERE